LWQRLEFGSKATQWKRHFRRIRQPAGSAWRLDAAAGAFFGCNSRGRRRLFYSVSLTATDGNAKNYALGIWSSGTGVRTERPSRQFRDETGGKFPESGSKDCRRGFLNAGDHTVLALEATIEFRDGWIKSRCAKPGRSCRLSGGPQARANGPFRGLVRPRAQFLELSDAAGDRERIKLSDNNK